MLAERTGLPYHAHFRTTDLYGGAYGIALLSRFPLEALAQYPLPVPQGAEPRTVAHALMQVAGREVSVYLTHLIRRPFNGAARVRQSALIAALLAKDPRPKLLMGDLNDDPDSRAVRLLRRELTDVVAASGQGVGGHVPAAAAVLPRAAHRLRVGLRGLHAACAARCCTWARPTTTPSSRTCG